MSWFRTLCLGLQVFSCFLLFPLWMCECGMMVCYCVWDNLLAALTGLCMWHFWRKCQLQITSVINSAAGWLILAIITIVYDLKERDGLDVLQLLFLRYLQGCVNSCHHLLTLTGINCCNWISLDSLLAVVDPLLASILAWNETWGILLVLLFSPVLFVLCGNLRSLQLIFLVVMFSL